MQILDPRVWPTSRSVRLAIEDGRVGCPAHGDADIEACFACGHLVTIEGDLEARVVCGYPADMRAGEDWPAR
jgi:hypothetical protein